VELSAKNAVTLGVIKLDLSAPNGPFRNWNFSGPFSAFRKTVAPAPKSCSPHQFLASPRALLIIFRTLLVIFPSH